MSLRSNCLSNDAIKLYMYIYMSLYIFIYVHVEYNVCIYRTLYIIIYYKYSYLWYTHTCVYREWSAVNGVEKLCTLFCVWAVVSLFSCLGSRWQEGRWALGYSSYGFLYCFQNFQILWLSQCPKKDWKW